MNIKLLKPGFRIGSSKKIRAFSLVMLIFLMGLIMLTGKFLFLQAQESNEAFTWPEGKKMALSLTFDDARHSQVDAGTPLFDEYGVRATFYVIPTSVEQRLDKWKMAVAKGHEIGNHSLNHPCTGNFLWAREKALENYTLPQMREELMGASKKIEALLGVKPGVYAYPCGQKFVGRGVNTRSYVPVIAELFISGRGWLDEAPNDPGFCDMSQLTGMEMDGKNFEEILPLVENARKSGLWLVLAGHEIGDGGPQTTRLEMLRKLIEYAKKPESGIWIAPVGEVAEYVAAHRNLK